MKGGLRALAIRTWRDHFPDATMLVEGKAWRLEPQPVLEGPEDLKRKINVLATEAKRIGYWEGDPDRMKGIEEEWDAIMGG